MTASKGITSGVWVPGGGGGGGVCAWGDCRRASTGVLHQSRFEATEDDGSEMIAKAGTRNLPH